MFVDERLPGEARRGRAGVVSGGDQGCSGVEGSRQQSRETSKEKAALPGATKTRRRTRRGALTAARTRRVRRFSSYQRVSIALRTSSAEFATSRSRVLRSLPFLCSALSLSAARSSPVRGCVHRSPLRRTERLTRLPLARLLFIRALAHALVASRGRLRLLMRRRSRATLTTRRRCTLTIQSGYVALCHTATRTKALSRFGVVALSTLPREQCTALEQRLADLSVRPRARERRMEATSCAPFQLGKSTARVRYDSARTMSDGALPRAQSLLRA